MSLWLRMALLMMLFITLPGCAIAQTREGFPTAAIQYSVRGSQSFDSFLKKFESLTREAHAGGARLVIFPELFTLDTLSYAPGARADTAQIDEIASSLTPALHALAKKLARELEISILAGTSPRKTSEGIFNTAALALPSGQVLLQDKLFLTPDEIAWKWKTGHSLRVFDAPWGRTTILICYDSEFPAISELLAAHQPEVILVPSMTADSQGLRRVRSTAQARAIEHYALVVLTGTTLAPQAEWKNYGQAAFLTPSDSAFPDQPLEGPLNQVAIVQGSLPVERLRAGRLKTGIYPARDQALRKAPIRVISSKGVTPP